MAHPPNAVQLFRRMRMRQAPSRPDFGDHGTAFGLELSIGEQAAPPEPSLTRPSPARSSSFWRRLAERRQDTER